MKSISEIKEKKNLDAATVASFGDEWSKFDQTELAEAEAQKIFEEYFAIFPWDKLPPNATGFDMGCGSGRWAKLAAPRVGWLHCIDPSSALDMARRALSNISNVSFHQVSVDDKPLSPCSQDFGYSLGVLHHVPNTAAAIRDCTEMLKPGAPFLIYLYYALDNRSLIFRLLWRCSDVFRRVICHLPSKIKYVVTDMLAYLIYFPLARFSLLMEKIGLSVDSMPLSHYRNHSLFTMRTDSRDRFGTPLEQRFTRQQIDSMLIAAGLINIKFSKVAPYWCAVGTKRW